MIKVFVIREVISHWQTSSTLNDGEIVELPLYAIIFSFHDKIESMEEDKDPDNSNISHTGAFFSFLGARSIIFASSAEKWLFFDRTICILVFLQIVIWINTLILEILK